MSKKCGLDQYGAQSFEQQQFGTAGVEGIKIMFVLPTHRNQFLNSLLQQIVAFIFLRDKINIMLILIAVRVDDVTRQQVI